MQDEFTISVMVKPNEIELSENKEYDNFPIVCIPGYDTGIFYNSFRRFSCQVYDSNKKGYSISSDILGERWVHLTLTVDSDGLISFYIDGLLLESKKMDTNILELSTDSIFVGSLNDKKNNTDFFSGLISSVEIYDIALTNDEIIEISENPTKPKLRNFGKFKSSEFLYSQLLPELSSVTH